MMLVVDLTFGASKFLFSGIEEGCEISEFDADVQKKWVSVPKEMFPQLPNL
jgi:hypothetical protein